ncbi:MAG: NAD(P)H-hydrate dehydratase, partial [Pseudomonadota bacterium]|nr:NAD(P)H-hydrate dehydratase [Pseudomonadota bacterium]
KHEKVMLASEMTAATILLKGADTIIARTGRKPVFHTHATAWLGTAGAGDVLAGMIGGLLAQGMPPFEATCAAAWMHGEAGLRKGAGLVAPDLIEEIPDILRNFS